MKNNQNLQSLKIVPLGGLGEVGRNMTVFEYQNNILIVDMGLRFPEEDMPGVDFIIPDVSYLEKRKKNIRGVIFTHGHYDHIGAVPYLIEELGYPPLYATALTSGLIMKRQEEFKNNKALKINIIKKRKCLILGPFCIDIFHQNHNIPDSVGLAIKTPIGRIIYTGDFKFDFEPIGDQPADLNTIARFGQEGVLLLMSDSTGAEKEGHSISEKTVQENLEKVFERTSGRLIIVTFSSLITRIQEIINLSEKYHRRILIEGFSMKSNFEIAKELNYLKIRKNTVVSSQEFRKINDRNLTILCTGAQGESGAALMKLVAGLHPYLKIKKGDSVVFSSSVIPGNERAVQGLKDDLYRQGARVYHNQMMDIHSGGHGHVEDLKIMMSVTKPKFFIPIHGNYSMLVNHAQIAQELGIKPHNIMVIENGMAVNITKKAMVKLEKKVPSGYVMVDGLGIGDVGNIVLRDRRAMACDGMFVVIITIDSANNKIKEEIDIISRGFIYLRESKKLLDETRAEVGRLINRELTNQRSINPAHLKNILRDGIGEFLFKKTRRRPMILPVIIEI